MFMKIVTFALPLICIIPSFASAAFKLPDTGQSMCFQTVPPYAEIPCAGTGQDGAYSINPMSYIDNGNGTVTDKNTGLTWQKEVDQQAYSWFQASGTIDTAHGQSRQNVCGMLNLGGQTDWRLPTKKELMSIIDYSVPYPGPTIKVDYFPDMAPLHYWSATSFAGNPDLAWLVGFSDGRVNRSNKYELHLVRCVRGRR